MNEIKDELLKQHKVSKDLTNKDDEENDIDIEYKGYSQYEVGYTKITEDPMKESYTSFSQCNIV